MERVSITFGDGKLTVKDEKGADVRTARATVYLVEGNDAPVALLEADGARWEVNVDSFELSSGAAAVVADRETMDEASPRRKR